MEHETILTSKDLVRLVPYSLRHLYRLEAAGDFPRRIKYGMRKVGWLRPEVLAGSVGP
ncbi:MAG: AlpA family phage regulatory protein [Burkholderiales bacterium]|nr:AlpA family phage regulatory protein [Burkholderiales bacterium]